MVSQLNGFRQVHKVNRPSIGGGGESKVGAAAARESGT